MDIRKCRGNFVFIDFIINMVSKAPVPHKNMCGSLELILDRALVFFSPISTFVLTSFADGHSTTAGYSKPKKKSQGGYGTCYLIKQKLWKGSLIIQTLDLSSFYGVYLDLFDP